ncbi:MAG: hypothetical protein R3B92_00205 [Patescibacteria group bacterium]|uniref:Uncharacterized protein n=1 Tax=candidate division WWE3 bacterium TaxID=2053526 RepID=A0A955EB15_UNCKA|nr:hypothetical protein [candidate division WWE3 bacterium]
MKDKIIEDIKNLGRKSGKEFTDKEAEDINNWLHKFANIVLDHAIAEHKRQKKLENDPKGFELEPSDYWDCPVCKRTLSGDNFWFDKHGRKCKDCQKMLNKKVIPVKILKDRNCWLTDWQITDRLKIHPATRDKLIREGKIIVRKLTDTQGAVYCRIYLKSENSQILTEQKSH